MKAILTKKGAKRLELRGMAGKQVEISDVRVRPWGSKGATLWINGHVYAQSVHVYTPGHGKDCALILLGQEQYHHA